MAPPKGGKKFTSQKNEKVFHPQSRKAEQLIRTQHRKSRLSELAKARSEKHGHKVDIFQFFYSSLPPAGSFLFLEDLHALIRDIWLPRFDSEIEEEKAQRRKGRPKSVKEQKLEELKLREAEDYRTGLEVIDLTHPQNVELFRKWDQKEFSYIQQLRFIRISSGTPDNAVLSRPGRHPFLIQPKSTSTGGSADRKPSQDEEMDMDEAPLLMEPPFRFGSTIMNMDAAAASAK